MAEDTEAIDSYLVWELCKQEGIQEMIAEGSADGKKLKQQIVEKVRKEYRENEYCREEKIELLKQLDSNPDYRSRIFRSCSWSTETVDLEDLGLTLPRAGDLPPEVISGSLEDVLRFVKKADPVDYRSVRYINELREVPEVLKDFRPWVVTPGKRPDKRDRVNEVYGGKEWDIEDTWGIINDGNHRTIAKILAGDLEQIECYVGIRPEE